MSYPFYLLTENTFHATYLVDAWRKRFRGHDNWQGIILREDQLSENLLGERAHFHRLHAGKHSLESHEWQELERLYPDLSHAERSMIADFGFPAGGVADDSDTVFIGRSFNNDSARAWVEERCAEAIKPYFFVFLDRILAPWWIDACESQIINAHSAVLPHARGTFAVEQAALTEDPEFFQNAAGATAHFVDNGVDTGPIIRAEKFSAPFEFSSIWSCKGHSFMLAYQILEAVASHVIDAPESIFAGVVPAPSHFGAPEYKRRDFTPDLHAASETAYLAMQKKRLS